GGERGDRASHREPHRVFPSLNTGQPVFATRIRGYSCGNYSCLAIRDDSASHPSGAAQVRYGVWRDAMSVLRSSSFGVNFSWRVPTVKALRDVEGIGHWNLPCYLVA